MPDNQDFIALFKAEMRERLTRLNNGIVELEMHPQNLELTKELNREAHTIKGASRVFGFTDIQDIAHGIEDRLEKVAQQKMNFNSEIAGEIFKDLDAIQ